MREMHELKEMLESELNKITKQGKITAGILDTVDKLTHSIKSIETIIAMNESGYSNGRDGYNSYAVNRDMSYADRRGRNADGSDRMRRDGGRDQRYNYSRESYDSYDSYDGYSGDLKRDLEDLMYETKDDHEKKLLKSVIHKLEG